MCEYSLKKLESAANFTNVLYTTYCRILGKRRFSKLYCQYCRGGGAAAVNIFLTKRGAVRFRSRCGAAAVRQSSLLVASRCGSVAVSNVSNDSGAAAADSRPRWTSLAHINNNFDDRREICRDIELAYQQSS